MADKLTPAACRALQPGQTLKDQEVAGLHLRARVNSKTWTLYYRARDGSQRKPSIGRFPEMSVSDARKAAKALKQRVAMGEDPSADWQASKAAPTVNDLCDKFMTDYAPYRNKPRTLADKQGMIDRHVKPRLGHKKVAEVTRSDCDKFLADIFNRKYTMAGRKDRWLVSKTAPHEANHVRTLLKQMFRVAKDDFGFELHRINGEQINPVAGTKIYNIKKRRRRADGQELASIFEQFELWSYGHPAHVAALWALFLTGARVHEIEKAQKAQLIGNRFIYEEHKTADYIGDKEIYLPPFVMQLVSEIKTKPDEPRLFGRIQLRWIWEEIRELAGCPDLLLLDARRTFLSFGLDEGHGLDQLGQLVGHTDTQTTRGYAWLIESKKDEIAKSTADAMLQHRKVLTDD